MAPRPQGKPIQRQLRQERRERQSFIKPLTGGRARKIAGAEAQTEFNPVVRQKKQEVRGSRKRQGEIGEWYGQLGQQLAQGQQNALSAFQTAQGATTQRLAAAGAQDQAALAQMQGVDAATAARLGGPVNTAGNLQAAQAAGYLAAQRAAIAAPIANQGAQQVGYLGTLRGAAALGGIKARSAQRQETKSLKQELGALRRERGQAAVKNLQTLRSEEGDRAVQRRAFGLEQQKFGAEQQAGRAEAAQKGREFAASQRQQGVENRQKEREINQEGRKIKQAGDGGRRTPSERRESRQGRRGAYAAGKSLFEQKEWKSWAQLEAQLRKEAEVSPQDARWATQKLKQQLKEKERREAQGNIHR